jgi:hypothetical protein
MVVHLGNRVELRCQLDLSQRIVVWDFTILEDMEVIMVIMGISHLIYRLIGLLIITFQIILGNMMPLIMEFQLRNYHL